MLEEAILKGVQLFIARYVQIHEMRREYNRFIYQGPSLTATVSGVVIGFALHGDSKSRTDSDRSLLLLSLLVLTLFALVMGLWVLRSRALLKHLESELIALENQMLHGEIKVYPSQINFGERPWAHWLYRRSSTLGIVLFQFVLVLVLAAGAIGVFLIM